MLTEPTRENLRYLHAGKRVAVRWFQRQPWGLERFGWIRETGTKGGRLHLHMLAKFRSRFLPFKRIQEVVKAAGLGIIDFEPIWRAADAARYVAKYMSKELAEGVKELAGERLFGITPGHNLPKNLDWKLLRPGDIPVWAFQPSTIGLVLGVPMYAIPPPA